MILIWWKKGYVRQELDGEWGCHSIALKGIMEWMRAKCYVWSQQSPGCGVVHEHRSLGGVNFHSGWRKSILTRKGRMHCKLSGKVISSHQESFEEQAVWACARDRLGSCASLSWWDHLNDFCSLWFSWNKYHLSSCNQEMKSLVMGGLGRQPEINQHFYCPESLSTAEDVENENQNCGGPYTQDMSGLRRKLWDEV